jgi:DNA-binding NtrC family response regulator
MDVLILERDKLIAEIFADALAGVGITTEITADDDQAMDTHHDSSMRVMITGINRRGEDMKGMQFGRAMRARCPWLAVIYMAALWPANLKRCALDVRERFLSKPVSMENLVRTVRELFPA